MNKIGYSLISVSSEHIYHTISKNVSPIILYAVHKNYTTKRVSIGDIHSYLKKLNIEIPTVILTKIIHELNEDFKHIKDDIYECQKDLNTADYDANWLFEMIHEFESYAKEFNYTVYKDYFFDLVQFISIFAENILLDRELNNVDRKNKVFFLNFIKRLKEKLPEKEKFEKLLKAILMLSFVKNFDEKATVNQYKKVNYVLDSNIIFALLDFQKEYFVKTSNEMISLLKNQDIKLNILDITVEEVKKLFHAYVARYDELKNNTNLIQDSSVFHYLYHRNYNRERTLELISNIDSFLRKKEINVLSTSSFRKYFLSEVDEYNVLQNDIYFSKLFDARSTKKINSASNEKNDFLDFDIKIEGIIHDANAVKSIKSLNATIQPDKVFDVAYTFITRDKIFFQTFQNLQKPEVVLSDSITLFYWLSRKEDQHTNDGHIPYDEILSFYASKTEILDDVWEKFLLELNENDVDEVYKKQALFYKISESTNMLDTLKEKSTALELTKEDVHNVIINLKHREDAVIQLQTLQQIHTKSQEDLKHEKEEKRLIEVKYSIAQEINEIASKNEDLKKQIDSKQKKIEIKKDTFLYKHTKKIIIIIVLIDLLAWFLNADFKTVSIINALLLLPLSFYGGKKIPEINESIKEINLEVDELNIQIEDNKRKKILLESQLKHGELQQPVTL